MQARFILRQDTQGLRTDVCVYASFFKSHTIVINDQHAPKISRNNLRIPLVDVTIHLEVVNHGFLKHSRVNMLMVNHEYFAFFGTRASLMQQLSDVDFILLKTVAACNAISRLIGSHALHPMPTFVYTRHTTPDPHVPCKKHRKPDFDKVLHFAGRSNWKQTDAVLQAWMGDADLPKLSVVCHSKCAQSLSQYISKHSITRLRAGAFTNITFTDHIVTDSEKCAMMQDAGIHLCPSIVEGYGHYINEARAVGAMIITANTPPMNELIDNSCGVVIDCSQKAPKPRSDAMPIDMCIIKPDQIRQAMAKVMALTVKQRCMFGEVAYRRYLQDNAFFSDAMKRVLARVASMLKIRQSHDKLKK